MKSLGKKEFSRGKTLFCVHPKIESLNSLLLSLKEFSKEVNPKNST